MQLMMFYVTTYENEQFFCLKQLPLAEIFIDTIKENENLQTGRVFFLFIVLDERTPINEAFKRNRVSYYNCWFITTNRSP